MLARDTTQGTTLEILAPYLPYKVEMAWVEAPNDMLGHGYYLRSLSDFEGHEVAISNRASRESFDWYPYSMVLPVLRPFSQLCTPLEDGTIPACQLANLIYAGSEDPITDAEFKDVSAGFGHFNELVVTVDGAGIMCIYSDWLIDTYGNCMVPPAAYDYLRSLHFAVNLEPHQYIAKSPDPTTATIEKGTAG